MIPNFDIQLMADTSAKMGGTYRKDLASLAESHGDSFAASVMGNVAVGMIVAILATTGSKEAREATLIGIFAAIATNLSLELSASEAEDLIARAMAKARAS